MTGYTRASDFMVSMIVEEYFLLCAWLIWERVRLRRANSGSIPEKFVLCNLFAALVEMLTSTGFQGFVTLEEMFGVIRFAESPGRISSTA